MSGHTCKGIPFDRIIYLDEDETNSWVEMEYETEYGGIVPPGYLDLVDQDLKKCPYCKKKLEVPIL